MDTLKKFLVLILIATATNSFVASSAFATEEVEVQDPAVVEGSATNSDEKKTADSADDTGSEDDIDDGDDSTEGEKNDAENNDIDNPEEPKELPLGIIENNITSTKDLVDTNEPPVVDADAWDNREIVLPTNSVSINDKGKSSDSDGTIVSYVWTYNSGPSNIDPDDIENPTVSGLVEGTYSFILTVTDDDGATAWDHVDIQVKPLGANAYCDDGVTLTQTEFIWARNFGEISYTGELSPLVEGDSIAWTITNNTGCILPVSLSAYKMYDYEKLSTQVWFDEDNSNNADVSNTLTINLPTCHAQIDIWFGVDAPNVMSDDNSLYGDPTKGPPTVIGWGFSESDDLCGDDSIDVCPNIEGNQTEIPDGMEKNSDGECVDEDNNGGGGSSSGSRRRSTPPGEVLGEQAPVAPIIPAVLGLPTTGVGDSLMNIIMLAVSGLITVIGLIALALPHRDDERVLVPQLLPVAQELPTASERGYSNAYSYLATSWPDHDIGNNVSYLESKLTDSIGHYDMSFIKYSSNREQGFGNFVKNNLTNNLSMLYSKKAYIL